MQLIIEALLLFLAALGQDHRAAVVEGKIYPLDMAPNSVDDQYVGCTEEMAELVKTTYLEKEKSTSDEFKNAWQEGEDKDMKAEDNLQKIHLVAIHVYTNKDSKVYSNFNSATRTDKQKYIEGKFNWHSLHFLLTEAIQIVKKTTDVCSVTYRGTTMEFAQDVLNKEVRFSSFTSSSLDRKVAQDFGQKSCFEIRTCEGVDVTKYSKYPDQKEVLIPPYEKFKVNDVKTKDKDKELWCDTVYTLQTNGKLSYLNCKAKLDKAKL